MLVGVGPRQGEEVEDLFHPETRFEKSVFLGSVWTMDRMNKRVTTTKCLCVDVARDFENGLFKRKEGIGNR